MNPGRRFQFGTAHHHIEGQMVLGEQENSMSSTQTRTVRADSLQLGDRIVAAPERFPRTLYAGMVRSVDYLDNGRLLVNLHDGSFYAHADEQIEVAC